MIAGSPAAVGAKVTVERVSSADPAANHSKSIPQSRPRGEISSSVCAKLEYQSYCPHVEGRAS